MKKRRNRSVSVIRHSSAELTPDFIFSCVFLFCLGLRLVGWMTVVGCTEAPVFESGEEEEEEGQAASDEGDDEEEEEEEQDEEQEEEQQKTTPGEYSESCADAEHGDFCELECPSGFRPTNKLVCNNGTWTPDKGTLGEPIPPNCVNTDLSCLEPPENPPNGTFPEDDSCTNVTDATQCPLMCDEGLIPTANYSECQGTEWYVFSYPSLVLMGNSISCVCSCVSFMLSLSLRTNPKCTTGGEFDGITCASDGVWPKTEAGKSVVAVCQDDPDTIVVRKCDAVGGWQSPTSDCEPRILRSEGGPSNSGDSDDGPISGLSEAAGWAIIGICIAVGVAILASAACCAITRTKKE